MNIAEQLNLPTTKMTITLKLDLPMVTVTAVT